MNTCPECNRFLGAAGHREGCSKSGLSPVASNPSLADALTAIRALIQELSGYTSVHGSDEDDEHALALGRLVLSKATAELTRERSLKTKGGEK